MNKVLAITGENGAGKTTALCAFKRMRAQILSTDYFIVQYMNIYKESLNPRIVCDLISKQISDYRRFNSSIPLFVEISLPLLKLIEDVFDEIIIISANSEIREIRNNLRNIPHRNSDLLGQFDKFIEFDNNNSEIDLCKQLEQFYKTIVPEINELDWEKIYAHKE